MQLISADTDDIPATLLLDKQRIKDMQKEFRFLATASTILVSLTSSLSESSVEEELSSLQIEDGVLLHKTALLEHLGKEIISPAVELESIIGAVSVALETKSNLSLDKRQSIINKLEQCTQITDSLNWLM